MYKNAFAYQKMGYAATIGLALALIIARWSSSSAGCSARPRHCENAPPDRLYAGLALAAATFIYPFLWMAATTFKPPAEVGTLSLMPDQPTFDNYRTMWARAPVGRALLNSTLVATTITAAVLVLGSITAYALARLDSAGAGAHAATLAVLLVPGQLTLIPTYALIVQLGWVDSYAALIVPYLFNATAILILRQFFLQIPRSLIDAARLDGMGELRILFTIFWPLARPALAIVGIFTFMGSWNEVLWPLLVVRDQSLMTLPQLLTVFALGGGAGSLGVQLAAAMVLVVPVCSRTCSSSATSSRAWPARGSRARWRPSPSSTSASASATPPSSTTSISRSPTASCWCWSAAPAPASPPSCACWPGSRRSPQARSASASATSPRCRPATATWPWSSRTTPSTRT